MNYLLPNWRDESSLTTQPIRSGFGEGIHQAGEKNNKVCLLNADLPGSLKVHKFSEAFPHRYFQVGVAEQNMIGIGTGLALQGKIPFTSTFAAFSPGLTYSQIRLAAMSHANLKIVGSHYGLNVGEDGGSAQMLSDVSIMRALPEITIMNPADYTQAIQAVHAIVERNGVDYLRVTRSSFPCFISPDAPFKIGKGQMFREGKDMTVIATGSLVYEALKATEDMDVDFINIHTIKPLDTEIILKSARKTGKVVIIEEHNVIGGLGDSVASCLSENHPTPLLKIGTQDVFGESGSHEDLWEKYGLDRDGIKKKIKDWI